MGKKILIVYAFLEQGELVRGRLNQFTNTRRKGRGEEEDGEVQYKERLLQNFRGGMSEKG